MIKKIFTAVLTGIAFYYFTAFILLQAIHLSMHIDRLTNIQAILRNITFDFSLLDKKVLFMIRVFAGGIVLWILIKDVCIHQAKSKYEKTSYNKLLTTHQRKRGTIRVQYDHTGKVTRKTLECTYDRLLLPLTRPQNKFCQHYHLPENKKWNTIHNFYNEQGELRHHCSGIPVKAYRQFYFFGKFNRVNYINNVIHALFIGMSGKGKSETFVLPMINANIDAGESMFVHDPKRELLTRMRGKLKEAGYKVLVIDFVNPDESEGWNPLAYPYDRWKKAIGRSGGDYHNADLSEAIELVLDISKTISYQEDAQNPFWHEGAGDMIAAAAFLAMEEGQECDVNFTTINYLYQLGEQNDVLAKFMDKCRTPEDQSVLKMDTYRSAEGVTKSGLKATFKNKMSLLTATPAIQKLLATNTWSYDDIFDKRTAVFMITHDEKSTYYPLVTIFVKQLYEAMIKWTRDHRDEYNNKLKIPWNLYIDEMGLLPEIKDIEAMFSAGRSRHMRMFCFFQSFSQLIQKYEQEGAKIIQDNSTHTIYLGSKLKEVADDFEKIAGDELYYDRKTKKWEERPLITSEKLQKFEKGRSLITAVEWNPYVAKLPPYTDYVFARDSDTTYYPIYKPPVHWLNIKDLYAGKQTNSYEKKGAKVIKFNSLQEQE